MRLNESDCKDSAILEIEDLGHLQSARDLSLDSQVRSHLSGHIQSHVGVSND